jgi:hypothetical protein
MAVGPGLRGYDGDNTNRNPSLVGCYGLGLDACLSLAHMQHAESYMSFGSDVGEEREDLENERQAVMIIAASKVVPYRFSAMQCG